MEANEASQVEEFAKIQDENEELKCKLQDSQASLQALINDHIVVTTKVSFLEARAKATEERVAQGDFIRDATIQEAVKHAVENFMQSEEYAAIMNTQYDTSYDTEVQQMEEMLGC